MHNRMLQIVSKQLREDEYKHRLSSFLFKKGNLRITQISRIKSNVFVAVNTNQEKFIVKGHYRKERLTQQWDFFEQFTGSSAVPFILFPNGEKMITGFQYHWVISKYIKGKKLDYQYTADRMQALRLLRTFHSEATGVFTTDMDKKDDLFKRWQRRLLSLNQTEYIFKSHRFPKLHKELKNVTAEQLNRLTAFPWEREELRAKKLGKWVHGDVAGHNFIETKSNVYLIDFDLLQPTNQLYDYIQLAQRFLPHLEWNVKKLLSYDMVCEEQIVPWLHAVAVPTDMIREWNYFLAKNPTSFQTKKYLQKWKSEWEKRKQLIREIRKLV